MTMNKNFLFKLILMYVLIISPFSIFAQIDPQYLGPDDTFPDYEGSNNSNNSNNSGGSGGGGTVFCKLASDPKFDTLVNYITCMITSAIVPLLFTLAFALFIWGVIQYTLNDTEEAKRAKGKQFMIWGIIALTVMFSVWGIVAIFGNTFGIDTKLIPQVAD